MKKKDTKNYHNHFIKHIVKSNTICEEISNKTISHHNLSVRIMHCIKQQLFIAVVNRLYTFN